MSNVLALAILEALAIISCFYGLYFLMFRGPAPTFIGLFHKGMWFTLGALSNFCGVIALYMMNYKDTEEDVPSQMWVQYHYLLAWLTIVIGYPTFVTVTWLTYYKTPWCYMHYILSIMPLVSWMLRRTNWIVRTTQLTMALAIISHFYITFLAGSFWGMLGASMMTINVIALSLPTRYQIWGFSSRELYVIGLATTSYVFCAAVADAVDSRKKITDAFPWFNKAGKAQG